MANVIFRHGWIAAVVAASVSGQGPLLVEFRRSAHLGTVFEDGRAAVFVDLDGDRDPDLAIAGAGGCRLLVNDGAGRFAEAATALPSPAGDAVALAAVDVDGDGDLDLVVGYADRPDHLLLDLGAHFVDGGALPAHAGATRLILPCDVDGDGDLDLLVGTESAEDVLLANDGAGGFAPAPGRLPARVSTTTAAVAVDLDLDGAVDLALGEADRVRLLRNDGSGRFTAASGPAPVGGAAAFALGDVDGDGDTDLLIGAETAPGVRLWLGDGAGGFVDGAALLPPQSTAQVRALALADLDRDGRLDLLVGEGRHSLLGGGHVRLWSNLGGGRFVDRTAGRLTTLAAATTAIGVVDLDADLDPDLLIVHGAGEGSTAELQSNDGAGRFRSGTLAALSVDAASPADLIAGDVDGDGDLDLFFAAQQATFSALAVGDLLLRFDGETGRFEADPAAIPTSPAFAQRARFADLDGDGDLDLVIAKLSFNEPSSLWTNDGTGRFADATAARLPGAPVFATDLAVGDVDGDGDPDLAFGQSFLGLPSRLYLNDGHGRFAEAGGAIPGAQATWTVALVDVDRDGDLDLIRAGSSTSQNTDGGAELLRNDGLGNFVADPQAIAAVPAATRCVAAAGDVDGDGDPDLVLGSAEAAWLLLNDGRGSFGPAPAGSLPALREVGALALGDLDLDGALDLVCGGPGPLRVLLGDGQGRFVDRTPRWIAGALGGVRRIELADLDHDGDLDLVLARGLHGALDGSRVLMNRSRAIELPWLPVPGRTFAIELSAEPGSASTFHVGIAVLGTGRAHVPLPPYGVFGIASLGLVQLDPVYLPPGSGQARIVLRVPADPALVGVGLHAQAALSSPLRTRLTNVATTVIVE
jgi:hypothetical protein